MQKKSDTQVTTKEFRTPLLKRTGKSAAIVVDVSDMKDKKKLPGYAFAFFGLEDPKQERDLSHQWLTEIVVATSLAAANKLIAEGEAKKSDSASPIGRLLHLKNEYSCSAVGRDLRIIQNNFAGVEQKWSYAIVNEEYSGSTMLVSEIWVAKCDDIATQCQLTTSVLKGQTLYNSDRYVAWEAIEYRVSMKL